MNLETAGHEKTEYTLHIGVREKKKYILYNLEVTNMFMCQVRVSNKRLKI